MPLISDAELSRLKALPVSEVATSRGVELERRGSELVGRCPLHEDETPSFVVNPSKNVWHCFGCEKGGSVIDLVMELEQVTFRHAVELLRQGPECRSLQSPISEGARGRVLLDEVMSFYRASFSGSDEAQAYLEKRGVLEAAEAFGVGLSDRRLGLHLGSMQGQSRQARSPLRAALDEVGVFRKSGHEHLTGCVVLPFFDEAGHVAELYGRRMRSNNQSIKHMYLPGPHAGVLNRAEVEGAAEVIVCEAPLDAMTFHAAGFKNVTTTFGATGLTDELVSVLKGARRIHLAQDADEAGERGARALFEALKGDVPEVFRLRFPKGMDANGYARTTQPARQALGLVLQSGEQWSDGVRLRPRAPQAALKVEAETASPPPAPLQAAKATLAPGPVPPPSAASSAPAKAPAPATGPSLAEVYEASKDEVTVAFGERTYRLRGLAKNQTFDALKVNIKASNNSAVHVDSLDLYVSKARRRFEQEAALELGESEEHVHSDVGRLLRLCERIQEELQGGGEVFKDKDDLVTLTSDERAEAMQLLQSPTLAADILADFEAIGVIGERSNKLVGYLAAVSRKLEQPLAVVIQSSSAAGKSSLMDSVLAFVPDEEKVAFSAMTGQSLFYMQGQSLKHKVLAIAEEEGADKASYALKILQSEGQLTIASTGKNQTTGRHVTETYSVEGPAAIFMTTTSSEVDEELMNRCLVLTVDETDQQTSGIHGLQRLKRQAEGTRMRLRKQAVLRRQQNAQRLLEPRLVVNPFASRLSFPTHRVRFRRDHAKYLDLIDTIALLHQHQRQKVEVDGVMCVQVEPADIELANGLMHDVMGNSLDELTPQTRRVLGKLVDHVQRRAEASGVEQGAVRFSRRELRVVLGVSHEAVRLHLGRLVEREYILAHRGKRGQSYEYELVYDGGDDVDRHFSGLTDAAVLETYAQKLQPPFNPQATPIQPPNNPDARVAEAV